MRDSFIIYKSFYESTKDLEPLIRCEIYDAIMQYEFDGIEKELQGVAKAIFTLIKPQLDANNQRYENGKKGGRPKTKTKPNQNQKETKLEPNVNVNVNDNVLKEKDNNKLLSKKKSFQKPTLAEVEEYCKERNTGINAQMFIDFYESKDWMIGKNKMKDWKACVRTWEKNKKVVIQQKDLPNWFNEEQNIKILSKEEQQEMESMLNEVCNIY